MARFIGYKVGNRKFGCSSSERERAHKLAKELTEKLKKEIKVELYSYKV